MITLRTPETRRKEQFRIISRLKRVIESFINRRVSCDLFKVIKGLSAFFFKKMQCDVWAPPLGKTHTLFPYLWQESKLNTNQYFVWFGEISLKITFVRASDHRQRRQWTLEQRGLRWFDDDNPLSSNQHIWYERGATKTEIDDSIAWGTPQPIK